MRLQPVFRHHPTIDVGDGVSMSPVVTTVYVSTWAYVLRVLQWIHNHRFDFILTVDPLGRGWEFMIEQPGIGYLAPDAILKEAGASNE